MNRIPILGWLLSFLLNVSLSIPFWLIWSVAGVGAVYFYWLPEVFHAPGFWAIVGLFICIEILKSVFLPSFRVNVENNEA